MSPHAGPGSCGSVSWLDGIKGDLNQGLVSLGLLLRMFVVFSNPCLRFFVCHLVVVIFSFASTSQVAGKK